jgi:hypothetical protein
MVSRRVELRALLGNARGVGGMSEADNFYAHFADCDTCFTDSDTAKLCTVGEELLFEAEDGLDSGWQRIAREIYRRQALEREADANFEYYKESDFDGIERPDPPTMGKDKT